jgi:hypothetical protein
MIPGITKVVIEGERNSFRFEDFCAELFTKVDGRVFVGTSKTYDRGRDARTTTSGSGTHEAVICCTLNVELDDKVKADIKRLVDTSQPDRLIYCTSQPATEDRLDKVVALIRKGHPFVKSVSAFGSIQISQLTDRAHQGIFEHFYGGEVKEIEQRLFSVASQGQATDKGLRLALTAFGSDTAGALRSEILRRAVLELLAKLGKGDCKLLSSVLSGELRLPFNLNEKYIEMILEQLQKDGSIVCNNKEFCCTPDGESLAKKVPLDAAKDLLQGRAVIREALERLIGSKIADKQFDLCWNALLDVLSELFYTNGFLTIKAVNAVLSGSTAQTDGSGQLDSLLDAGAKRVANVFQTDDLRMAAEQAVHDMFKEHVGPAFEWLATVCERFVALCALGLEQTSAEEIRLLLQRQCIVLDSDIVLTLLCVGEPEHASSRDLMVNWRKLGGSVVIAPTVLEEVAHHAWIAQNDFVETEKLLGKLDARDRLRYINNAFVRAYHTLENKPARWQTYINQYKGSTSHDYGKIAKHLRQTFSAELLPNASDADLDRRISNYLVDLAAAAEKVNKGLLDKKYVGKAERDGHLLACIASIRQAQEKIGSGIVYTVLSSSPRLRKADNKFRAELGEPNAVIPLSALSYLISLMPEASLGMGTLRNALFEFGDMARLMDEHRIAMRIIRATEEFDIPWATRGILEEKLQGAIHQEAQRRGVSDKALKSLFDDSEYPEAPATVILETVRAMAADSRSEGELTEAKQKISELEKDKDNLVRKLGDTVRELQQAKKKSNRQHSAPHSRS